MFDDSLDPIEAEDWLKKIQRLFTYMGLEDHKSCLHYQSVGERSFMLVAIRGPSQKRKSGQLELFRGELPKKIPWRSSTLRQSSRIYEP